MKTKEETMLKEVFSGSPWEAELIKGLLESVGIQAALKDGIIGTLAPYISNSVVVLVSEECYEAAKEVINSREQA